MNILNPEYAVVHKVQDLGCERPCETAQEHSIVQLDLETWDFIGGAQGLVSTY